MQTPSRSKRCSRIDWRWPALLAGVLLPLDPEDPIDQGEGGLHLKAPDRIELRDVVDVMTAERHRRRQRDLRPGLGQRERGQHGGLPVLIVPS